MQEAIQIPGYDVREHMGSSSQTDVWRAFQTSVRRDVTLKVLKPEFAADPDEVERFHDEARRTAHLKHDAIMCLYDVCQHEGRHILVMEYVAGPTVEQVLRSAGRIPVARALRMALQTAEALEYAWISHKLIHRNVTPRSIFLGAGPAVKLGYFGLSLRVDPSRPDSRLSSGMTEGTPQYMSPEQASGSPALDCRSDMYSLGATLYHMLTGVRPFGNVDPVEAMRQHISGTLPRPDKLCPGLSSGVYILLRRLMMKDPGRRFADWESVAVMIERVLSGKIFVQSRAGGESPSAGVVSTIP